MMWNDAVGYEAYVGHWSRVIAPRFLAWLTLPARLKWLDIACGTGALTSAILACCDPSEAVGLDSSAD
jgi:ubiquinone/menaquinone biosynthesis C-methylase UbiE